jgi:predicted dithiol-disulfide oxidoreductase (DUF899 family)
MTAMGSLPEVVSREEWLAARRELLAKEKAVTRARDQLNADRRRLPMVRTDKPYTFEGADGTVGLLDLTALGRQEEWEEPDGTRSPARPAGRRSGNAPA